MLPNLRDHRPELTIRHLGAIAQYTSFTTPIALKLLFDNGRFRRGPWHLGKFSKPVNAVACIWWLIIVPALCFPAVKGADLNPLTMNWTCLVGRLGRSVSSRACRQANDFCRSTAALCSWPCPGMPSAPGTGSKARGSMLCTSKAKSRRARRVAIPATRSTRRRCDGCGKDAQSDVPKNMLNSPPSVSRLVVEGFLFPAQRRQKNGPNPDRLRQAPCNPHARVVATCHVRVVDTATFS